jgi:putative hemolysin
MHIMQTHSANTENFAHKKLETFVATAPRFSVSLAANPTEIREAQRLRLQIFFEARQLSAVSTDNLVSLDIDEFDKDCEHLIVRDVDSNQVVGCYRIMRPEIAAKRGGYYSDQEFDLHTLDPIRPHIAEAGRACIHPQYRSGAVIMLLWSGLTQFMIANNYQYMIGCASIPLNDPNDHTHAVAVYREMERKFLSPLHLRVTPKFALPLPSTEAVVAQIAPTANPIALPPLLKGYTRLGAWICGAPAWDKAFNTADLFTMLSLSQMNKQYAKHFIKINATAQFQQ